MMNLVRDWAKIEAHEHFKRLVSDMWLSPELVNREFRTRLRVWHVPYTASTITSDGKNWHLAIVQYQQQHNFVEPMKAW